MITKASHISITSQRAVFEPYLDLRGTTKDLYGAVSPLAVNGTFRLVAGARAPPALARTDGACQVTGSRGEPSERSLAKPPEYPDLKNLGTSGGRRARRASRIAGEALVCLGVR